MILISKTNFLANQKVHKHVSIIITFFSNKIKNVMRCRDSRMAKGRKTR